MEKEVDMDALLKRFEHLKRNTPAVNMTLIDEDSYKDQDLNGKVGGDPKMDAEVEEESMEDMLKRWDHLKHTRIYCPRTLNYHGVGIREESSSDVVDETTSWEKEDASSKQSLSIDPELKPEEVADKLFDELIKKGWMCAGSFFRKMRDRAQAIGEEPDKYLLELMKVVLTLKENKILPHPMFKVTVGPPCIRIGLKDDRYGDLIREVLREDHPGGLNAVVRLLYKALVAKYGKNATEQSARKPIPSKRSDAARMQDFLLSRMFPRNS